MTDATDGATEILDDKVFGLDPQLTLRNDVDRNVVISRPPPLSDRNYIRRFVDPAEAVILALCNGRRTVREVADLWAKATNRPLERALAEVRPLVAFHTSNESMDSNILIPIDAPKKRPFMEYDPVDFIMSADSLDLDDKRLRIPYRIYYIPTLYCPQDCIYCYAKRTGKPENDLLPLARLCEIFDELAGLGVDVIQMSGGEVFTRRDIFDVLEAILARGMVPDIPTKIGLSYKAACRLRDMGIPLIQVSLDSAEPEILDTMVGVESYHGRVFTGFDNLRRVGLGVRVNAVLTPLNIGGVGALIDFLGQFGNVSRLSLSPYGRSLFCHSDELFVDEAQVEMALDEAREKARLYPHLSVTISGMPAPPPKSPEEHARRWQNRAYCSANRDGIVILPDGGVTVCEELYDHPAFMIGDLKRQSVMEVWRSPEALALLHPDQGAVNEGACRGCRDFEECNSVRGRCWRDVLKSYGWDKPHFPDPKCPKAPRGARLS